MSKRIWHHPETPATSTVAWRSPGQLEDTPQFREWMDREFPRGAAELAGAENETSRRSFLKLMGASSALAGFGMVGCRRPESYIVPYAKAPEWVIPGKATYYASAMPRARGATPLVVTTFEGRPTRVAPNRLHPDVDGTDAFAQASILDLYSPSRSRRVLRVGEVVKRDEFETILATVAKNKSAKLGIMFGADDSPTRTRLVKELAGKFSAAKFYQYEALEGEGEAGTFGDGVRQVVDFEKADKIVSLDCDFTEADSQGPVKGFFDRRKPEGAGYDKAPDAKSMNRLYVIESAYSLTGGMADHRLRVTPSQVNTVAAELAKAVGAKADIANATLPITDATQLEWIKALAADLKESRGKSVVLAGARQPLSVHLLAFAINEALGNVGKTVTAYQTETKGLGTLAQFKKDVESGAIDTAIFLTPSNPVYDAPADFDFTTTLRKLKLSIHSGLRTDATARAADWHLPAAHYLESWADARTSRGLYTVVQPMILPLYRDCVSEIELLLALLADDGKLRSGEGEKGAASPAYDAVRATFTALGKEGDGPWKKLLRDGFAEGTSYTKTTPQPRAGTIAPMVAKEPAKDSLEIVFATDASVYDGRWIDNGWLQEAPDPISKLTWDNAALIAPKTAKALGIYDHVLALEPVSEMTGLKNAPRAPQGDDEGEHRSAPMIKVTVNGKSLEIPVLISFGQAENTVIIPLGYGQGFDKEDELGRKPENADHVGLVGVNTGFNVYPLRTSTTPYFATGGTVSLIKGKRYSVALTQEHSAMYGRALAREVSTMPDEEKGDFEAQLALVPKQGNDAHAPPNVQLYQPKSSSAFHPGKDGKAAPLINDPLHQWGMSIDLSSCTGCNSCLIACQSENNIPIVGKREVARGREMHWIRMDRYFAVQEGYIDEKGKEQEAPEWVKDNPVLVPQPVACVQCESAPCETVCPVNATIHTEDGLNAMAYNRCIGTRYCANNCPYKARRFNYFDYNKRNPLIAHNLYKGPFGVKQVGEAPHLQKNPNVTVRMRGVMEKCTYCVQRLKDALIRQKRGQKQEALEAGKPSTEMTVTEKTLRVPVDSVRVACQDACSAGAITFGNKLDGEKSLMMRAKGIARNYDLLNYLGTRPRTSYLARVKNPNPAMPDAKFIGKATIHMA